MKKDLELPLTTIRDAGTVKSENDNGPFSLWVHRVWAKNPDGAGWPEDGLVFVQFNQGEWETDEDGFVLDDSVLVEMPLTVDQTRELGRYLLTAAEDR